MPSVAELILARIAALLTAGPTAAGARVFRWRNDALSAAELPALIVERVGTEVESASFESAQTTLDFAVHHYTQGSDWETTADALHMQVHGLLHADAQLSALGQAMQLAGTKTQTESADRPAGRLTARYTLLIFTPHNDPSTLA